MRPYLRMKKSVQPRRFGFLLATSMLVPAMAGAQRPWTVTVTPTLNPLPIGSCGAVWLKVFDPRVRENPRNPSGTLISIADFDLTVTAPDGKSVVGQYTDAFHWSVCACQGAAIGAVGTITASYPGQSLSARTRVANVAFQTTATFQVAPAMGAWNPPGCPAPPPATIAAAGVPSTPVQPPPSAIATLPLLGPAPATAVPLQPVAATPVAVQPVTTQPIAVPAGTQPVALAPVTTKTAIPTAPVTTKTAVPIASLAALPGPAPTGVTVTATPASATLSWQPVAGVASYVVTRQQANVPAVEQTLAATNIGMYDSGLQPATAYTWTIRAIQTDGREGSTSVTFATPPAVNPSGFAAQQVWDGTVRLSWQPRTLLAAGFAAAGSVSTVPIRTIAAAGFTAAGGSSVVPPRTIASAGFTATGTVRTLLKGLSGTVPSVLPASRTIVAAGFSATGGASTVAPRTISASGFTASGGVGAIPPRLIKTAGWTAAGTVTP